MVWTSGAARDKLAAPVLCVAWGRDVSEQRTVARVWPDIGFAVVAKLDSDHWMDFKAYQVIDVQSDGTVLYCRDGSASRSDPVELLADAQVYVSGHVKWDECSNIHFDKQDGVMLHFCDRSSAVAIGELLGRIYDLAETEIPMWDC